MKQTDAARPILQNMWGPDTLVTWSIKLKDLSGQVTRSKLSRTPQPVLASEHLELHRTAVSSHSTIWRTQQPAKLCGFLLPCESAQKISCGDWPQVAARTHNRYNHSVLHMRQSTLELESGRLACCRAKGPAPHSRDSTSQPTRGLLWFAESAFHIHASQQAARCNAFLPLLSSRHTFWKDVLSVNKGWLDGKYSWGS